MHSNALVPSTEQKAEKKDSQPFLCQDHQRLLSHLDVVGFSLRCLPVLALGHAFLVSCVP